MPDVLRFVPSARAKTVRMLFGHDLVVALLAHTRPFFLMQIRNFAKQLEPWMAAAMRGMPEVLVARKLSTVGAFAQASRKNSVPPVFMALCWFLLSCFAVLFADCLMLPAGGPLRLPDSPRVPVQ